MPRQTPKIPDREDFDANEWGNIGKEEVFKKTSLELAWTKERKQKQMAGKLLERGFYLGKV